MFASRFCTERQQNQGASSAPVCFVKEVSTVLDALPQAIGTTPVPQFFPGGNDTLAVRARFRIGLFVKGRGTIGF